MNNYFRITGYNPDEDYSFIVDCYGVFEKLWQFSSYLVTRGLKVLEVSDSNTFLDVNLIPIHPNEKKFILRATCDGKPEYLDYTLDNKTYKAIKVADKIYIPNKNI